MTGSLSVWVLLMITPCPSTLTRTMLSYLPHNYCQTPDTFLDTFLGPTHHTLYSWSVIVVKKTRTQDHLSRFILFRNENGFWFPFDGNGKLVRNEVSPFPLHLMMALNIYLYKLMITNEPFCPVCLPDPDTSLSFFVGTLQKYTVTEHWQKQQNILPR